MTSTPPSLLKFLLPGSMTSFLINSIDSPYLTSENSTILTRLSFLRRLFLGFGDAMLPGFPTTSLWCFFLQSLACFLLFCQSLKCWCSSGFLHRLPPLPFLPLSFSPLPSPPLSSHSIQLPWVSRAIPLALSSLILYLSYGSLHMWLFLRFVLSSESSHLDTIPYIGLPLWCLDSVASWVFLF